MTAIPLTVKRFGTARMAGERRSPEKEREEAWNRLADSGRVLLVGAAIIAPASRRDFRKAFDAVSAILASSAASKAMKALWDEPRPNGENNNSFPSQHAAECFAAAANLARKWPQVAGPLAIGLAAGVSAARVFGRKHHVPDVLAGVALGLLAEVITSVRSAAA